MGVNRYLEYLQAVRDGAEKCARLEFLQPDGSVGFRVDGDHRNRRSGCFLQSGWLSCNRKNGMRRYATVTLGNPDGEFSYAVNHLWYGTRVRLMEGVVLPDGEEFLLPQGVFEIVSPVETVRPGNRSVTWTLCDKWVNLDGTLWGTLEGDYSIGAGTNVFSAMESLLRLDRYDYSSGGSNPVDGVKPVFSTYWNGRTQTLTDGRTVPLTSTPYSLLTEGGKTLADILLSLAGMLAADIGYNRMGRLCVEPGSETGQEESRPVLWEFGQEAPELFGLQETAKNRELYNDVIVVGATGDANVTARGRACNTDPASAGCIQRAGRKIRRVEMPDYYSDQVCQDYAAWLLRQLTEPARSVVISCQPMFHMEDGGIVTVERDGVWERYLVQGFSRPIGCTGEMQITGVRI